jgi:ABC-2 type transport system permease protein
MLIAIPMMFPMYLWVGVVSAPHGLLAVSLSLIPFTAPVAMLMRMTSTTVPGWQIALSLVLLALTAVGTIWFMSRLFKVQTLLSGEAISFRRIWSLLVAR